MFGVLESCERVAFKNYVFPREFLRKRCGKLAEKRVTTICLIAMVSWIPVIIMHIGLHLKSITSDNSCLKAPDLGTLLFHNLHEDIKTAIRESNFPI